MLDMIRDDQGADGDVPEVVPVDWSHTFPHQPRDDPTGPRIVASLVCTSAYPLLAAAMLEHYNDVRVVTRHWPALETYMMMLQRRAGTTALPNFEVDCGGSSDESSDGYQSATGAALAAFKYIRACDAMANLAMALPDGDGTAAAVHYHTLANASRILWHESFWNESLQSYGYIDGEDDAGLVMQSVSAAALTLGQLPLGRAAMVVRQLHADLQRRKHHMTVGEVGVRPLLRVLSSSQAGLHDDAMQLLLQRSFPSYGYWLDNNATTCWESWSGVADASHPGQPTHNHVMLCGGADDWLFSTVLGLRPLAPGWARVQIAPRIAFGGHGPAAANATVTTMAGMIRVAWQRSPNSATLMLQASAATPATVIIPPCEAAAALTVREGGVLVFAHGVFVPSPGVAGIFAVTLSATAEVKIECASGEFSFVVGYAA